MKHRVPTPAELKLWRESNRFTRKAKDDEFSEEDIEEDEAPTLRVEADSGTQPAAKLKPVTQPLTHLRTREAARFIKSYPEIEATLDLHGLNKLDAYAQVHGFITRHYRAGRRHLLIITGKGRAGPGLLKTELPHWLNEPALRPLISAFAHGRPEKGGNGVTHVLVKQYRG